MYLNQEKIRSLGDKDEFNWLIERVFGSAKKYVVDSDWNTSQEVFPIGTEMQIPNLHRSVYLQRKNYFEVISSICQKHQIKDFRNLLVIGDIFELDLALPLCLGARVALMTNDHTPQYEKDFLFSHPNGHLVSNLTEAIDLIQS